jgi:protocatechuate 3,4-dioxygenase beta subunit
MSQVSVRPRTPDQILGPYFPVGRRPSNGDLTSTDGQLGQAQGEIIDLVGRVLNRAGEPIPSARLVIWQANSFGRYVHPNDSHQAPLDPNFIGFADICTEHDGGYRIRTVKPGAYPLQSGEMRAPHIHFVAPACGWRTHSITSSASASTVSGTVRPSALAVLRLITNSNLVGCMTGRSAGFSPLRILPV